MPFYKKLAGEIHEAKAVHTSNYTLIDQEVDNNTYPIDGWYRADSLDDALQYFTVSTTVTSAQFKCALGVTRFTQIESVLAAMPDADEQFEYTQYWLNTTEFNISHPMVVAMQSILGWSDADRDQLFIDASNK